MGKTYTETYRERHAKKRDMQGKRDMQRERAFFSSQPVSNSPFHCFFILPSNSSISLRTTEYAV